MGLILFAELASAIRLCLIISRLWRIKPKNSMYMLSSLISLQLFEIARDNAPADAINSSAVFIHYDMWVYWTLYRNKSFTSFVNWKYVLE